VLPRDEVLLRDEVLRRDAARCDQTRQNAVAATQLDLHKRVAAGLQRRLAGHGAVRTIQTHISTVLLAGADAYKLKKPVALGFLDFSTLAARRQACEDELRLNRRTAPGLYLDVVPIIGTPEAPMLGAPDAPAADVIDYAVHMRRFDETQVLDSLAQRGALPLSLMAPLGRAVAQLHAQAAVAPLSAGYGTAETVRRWTAGTITALREHTLAAADRARLDALALWCEAQEQRYGALIETRRRQGRVRECHGDLHLGNFVLLEGAPLLFDALEFNAELRFIDVMSDVAFLWMDLADHDLPMHAAHVLDGWLEECGDADGLPLLRYFAVYRALVRGYVALLRAQQPDVPVVGRVREHTSFAHYLALAERLQVPQPTLVVMTGLSGSGKSTIAAILAERLGGVRVRSDVERKRLAGIDWRSAAASAPQLYSAEMTARTYARLQQVADAALSAGVPVVVDAASLRAHERRALIGLAKSSHVGAVTVECTAPLDILRHRVAQRAERGVDPSDATVAVLESQLQWREPASADESAHWMQMDTAAAEATQRAACDAVLARLGA
jgi:aminoglycoside phosphotransferase family enzyme/predicted kinase